MNANAPRQQTHFTSEIKTLLLATGCVLTLSMGVRHGFGFWLQPISAHHEWTRETYSNAMALQNLLWGAFGPLAGLLADRIGTAKVIGTGAILFAAGLFSMSVIDTPWLFVVMSGLLNGAALACTTFSVVSGLIARKVSPELRSSAFGISSAASSFGQFLMMPIDNLLIHYAGWDKALWVLSAAMLVVILPISLSLKETPQTQTGEKQLSVWEATREAFSHTPFILLLSGYFVCGFQLVFIGVNMPAYLQDKGITNGNVAVTALSLIGLFNIAGSYFAGQLGNMFPKRYVLSIIYLLRSIAMVLFLWAPLSSASIYVFSAAMGVLWLSTVPLTNGVIAGIFGVKNLSMLSGFVFFSHQVGSFIGAWLAGFMYAKNGNYDGAWMVVIALGIFAAVVNLPINESAIQRNTSSPKTA